MVCRKLRRIIFFSGDLILESAGIPNATETAAADEIDHPLMSPMDGLTAPMERGMSRAGCRAPKWAEGVRVGIMGMRIRKNTALAGIWLQVRLHRALRLQEHFA